MRNVLKKLSLGGLILLLAALLAVPAFAAGEDPAAAEPQTAEQAELQAEAGVTRWKAVASALAIGVASVGGAVSMGLAAGKATESISRQPEAEGKIRTTLMLGLVFIETAIIYALLAVILIIFVL